MQILFMSVLAFLLAVSQGAFAQNGEPVYPQVRCSWNNGDIVAARDSGGALTFLRSPVVYDDLSVLAAIQQHGPIPGQYGQALLQGVDSGTVNSYHGPGFVLWYFHRDLGLPRSCRGQTRRHAAGHVRRWWNRTLLGGCTQKYPIGQG